MKPDVLLRIYAGLLLVVFGGIVLHAPLSVGLGVLLPEVSLLVKSWKEILLLLAMPAALWLLWQQQVWQQTLSDRIIQVAALYSALHVLTATAMLTGPLATLAGLAIDLRYIVFFVLVHILIKLAPEYKKRFLQVAAIGAVIVIGFGVIQLFLPADILKYIGYSDDTIKPFMTVDENPDYIRINSTLRGPNPLGAYLVVVIGVLSSLGIKKRALLLKKPKHALFAAGAMIAILAVLWATFSRSAVAAAGLAALLVAGIAGRRLVSRRVWIAVCVVAFALIGGVIAGRDSSFVENVILHENSDGGSAVSSNEEHITSLRDGLERMIRQPVGAGIGSTGSASLMTESPLIIENQYLFIAHEVGWLGLILFLLLMYLLLARLWRQRQDWLSLGVFASGIGLGLIGVLLPVWADDTVSIVWWGLAAVAITRGGGKYDRS